MTNPVIQKFMEVIYTLTPREQAVIIARFDLFDTYKYTLEKTALGLGVTRERIRQIEAKALRKLRHKNRIFILKKLNYYKNRKFLSYKLKILLQVIFHMDDFK